MPSASKAAPPKTPIVPRAAITKNESGLYEATIDGLHFEFVKWGAADSLAAIADVLQVGGQSMAVMLAATGLSGEMPQLSSDVINSLMSNVIAGLRTDKALALDLIRRFASVGVFHKGQAINFDLFYKEDGVLMYKVLAAAAEVQLGRFFAGTTASAPGGPTRPEAPTPYPYPVHQPPQEFSTMTQQNRMP